MVVMPDLVVRPSSGRPYEVDLGARNQVSVGRGPDNDIVVNDPALSRRHAVFVRSPSGWEIYDVETRNGTYVNDKHLQTRTALRAGDVIKLGRTELAFQPGGPEVTLSESTIAFEDTVVLPGKQTGELGEEGWLEVLADTNRALAHQPYPLIHTKVLDLVRNAFQPERAAVFSWEPDHEPVCKAEWGGHGDGSFVVSRTLAGQVTEDSVSVLLADRETNLASQSLTDRGVSSAMAAPLLGRDGVSGFVYLETLSKRGQFTQAELERLTVLTNVAATHIENAALSEERAREHHLQEQALEAARIQERLLPTSFPEIPGYEFEWHYVSCFEVGGDYCDCLALDGERHAIVVADVAGKGLGAAMLMAVTQATFRSYVQIVQGTDDLAKHLNRAIFTATPSNRFVTFFFAELDHRRHRLRYANVGHQPAPVIVRAGGGIETLHAGSFPLGMMPEVNCPVQEVQLEPGDFLFACSDGVTDSMDPEENLFGGEQLLAVLDSCRAAPVKDVRRAVNQALSLHTQGTPQPDDLTIAVLRRVPSD